METGREVRRIDRPDWKRPHELASALEFARCGRSREQRDIHQIRQQQRPKQGDGTGEEEDRQENGDGEGVAQHNERLQSSLQADVQRRPVDAFEVSVTGRAAGGGGSIPFPLLVVGASCRGPTWGPG